MAKIKSIQIENYRSIGSDPVHIKFKENEPLILIGENNSGKTNILRALDIMFGEWHPKYIQFDDHDYHGRNPSNTKIIISVECSGYSNKLGRNDNYFCDGFKLEVQKNAQNNYVAIQSDGNTNQYVSNELRNELVSILINSEKDLSYQLSYASKYTLLSKVTKAFHDRLIESEERVQRLKEFYSQIISTFYEVPEFKKFKDEMSSITGQFIQNMTHALQLDFSAYDPSNYFKGIRVQPHEEGQTLNFDELGSGQQQILALSFAHAYAKCFKGEGNFILILDEPEANLHPIAQKWLAKNIFNMAKEGLQIIISTHSPYFIDLEFLESIYLITKENGQTVTKNITISDFVAYCNKTGAKKVNTNTIIPFYVKSATFDVLKGFFAKKIILVEGPTEELALPIYFEKVELDLWKEGIDIINVGGKGNLAKWWRLFTAFKIPCYIIFDDDNSDDRNGEKRRDILKTIGINDDRVNIYLNVTDWTIEDRFCVFKQDFETTMRNLCSQYKKLEEKIKEELGDSKPLIAREVARELVRNVDNSNECLWKKFSLLKKKILNLK